MRRALRDEVRMRREYLEKIKASIVKTLPKYPKGKLRASVSGKSVQYYHRTEKNNRYGKYIRRKDRSLAEQLAQKEYEGKLLASIESELGILQKYEKEVEAEGPEKVFSEYNILKRPLIIPRCTTAEDTIALWQKEEYTPKAFWEDSNYITSRGEKMRSKSEMLIAERLNYHGIAYKYEKPLVIAGSTLHPDFTIMHPKTLEEVYLEHLGMMDMEEYAYSAVRRLNLYQENGIVLGDRLFITYESATAPLNFRVLDQMIKVLFL